MPGNALVKHPDMLYANRICTDGEGEQIQLGSGGFGRVLLGARNEHQVFPTPQLHTNQALGKFELHCTSHL